MRPILHNFARLSAYRASEGITPVAERDRVDTHYSKIFFIWLSANFNILSCVFKSFRIHIRSYIAVAASPPAP